MYENISVETILNRMSGRAPKNMDKREGSLIYDALSPAALELEAVYIELERLIKESYGDTASREYLIMRCKERGIVPEPSSKAVLKGVFAPSEIDVLNKRFNIGEINYTVTGKISDGVYSVTCDTPGREGGRHFGTMIPIDYVAGLQSAELVEILIPGEDEEDTELLRQRYFDSFKDMAFGGNVRDYLNKTKSIPGVGSVKVTRAWNADIKPSDMLINDAVKSWYESVKGSVAPEVQSWLTNVYTAASKKKLTTGGTVLLTLLDSEFSPASEALIKRVGEILDPEEYAGEGLGLAPIGHVVSVKSAKAVPIFVNTSLVFESGYGWDNLSGQINSAVSDYLLEIRKQWEDSETSVVRISRIEMRLLNIKGVADISGTKINGLEKNFELGEFEVPVLGGAGS